MDICRSSLLTREEGTILKWTSTEKIYDAIYAINVDVFLMFHVFAGIKHMFFLTTTHIYSQQINILRSAPCTLKSERRCLTSGVVTG